MTDYRRCFEGSDLIVASHNTGKISEIGDLLAPFGVASIGADALGLDEPEETGADFIANAELKALAAADLSGLPALSDDSGLCVEALGGDPGLFSARWAGPPAAPSTLGLTCARARRCAAATAASVSTWSSGRG